MKTKLIYLVFLLSGVLFVSCEIEEKGAGPQADYSSITEVSVKIAQNSSIEYGIDIDDGLGYGCSVFKQPDHGQGELLTVETLPAQLIYCYKPDEDFIGTDVVEVYCKGGSYAAIGSWENKHILRIKFDVQGKDVPDYSPDIKVTLKDKMPYTYFLSWNFFQQEFEIVSSPDHAADCEIVSMDEYPFQVYFRYTPKANFRGTDYVEVISHGTECGTTPIPSTGWVHNKYRFAIEVK